MTRLYSSFLLIIAIFVASPAYGQDVVRRLSLEEFFQGLELKRYDGQNPDYGVAGRRIVDYTLVTVPAGAFEVRFMYPTSKEDSINAYLVITDAVRKVGIRDGSGELKTRDTTIRLTYICKQTTDTACRQKLQEALRNGLEMQSLGVSNDENPKSDILPEGNVIFSFFVREDGKF